MANFLQKIIGRTPERSIKAGTSGRWFKRSGASTQGTLSNWVSQLITNRLSELEKRKVADRSWDLYLNDAMAHGIIEGLITEGVGTGLTPQAQPMLGWLGLDVEWQQQYQQKVYDLFEIWGLDPRNFCDATQRQNIYMLQALALFHWKLDGIGIFQRLSLRNPLRPLSLSFLPIDPSRLITPFDKQSADIYDGLELGSNGEIRAAWVIKNSASKTRKLYVTARSDECIRIPATDPTTGLPNLLTVCDVRNVAEYRQDSVFGSMIKELRDNSDFVEAALVKSLLSNLFTIFVNDAYGSNPNSGTSWADRVQELEKGTIIIGNATEKPEVISTGDAPGPNFNVMFENIVKRLGMATGRGPENVSREYKASYSASQASMENAGKFDDVDRAVLVNRFCQPALMWLEYEAVLRGMLPVQSVKKFVGNLHAYTRTQWQPPPLRPIDKLKAANADDVRLANRTRSYADIYGEKSQDWRSGLRQIAIELAYIEELEAEYGVDMSAEKAAVVGPPQQDEGQDAADKPDSE